MKNFILIDHEPWTVRRKQLFYDLFEKANIPLKVWDLSQWLYPGFSNPDELSEESYLTRINSYEQYKKELNSIDPENAIIIEEVFRKWENRLVYREVSKRNIKTIKIELYGNTALKESFLNKIKYIKAKDLWRIGKNKIKNVLLKSYNSFYRIKGPSEIYSSLALNRTKPFNHPDYEDYKFKIHKNLMGCDYIVFCDIYFPYHPDLKFFYGLKKLPSGRKYQQQMCRYFDTLETKYNMPVVIAAHPKSNYKEGTFGGRKIIKYHTDDLVYNASMVTMHICNSVSFSILGDKPIAFISTDDYYRVPNFERHFKNLAEIILGLKIYNIDHCKLTDIKFTKIDSIIRKEYIYNYLTTKETENKQNYAIIRDLTRI